MPENRLGLFVSTFGTHTFFVQGDAAERTTIYLVLSLVFTRASVDTAREGNLGNVKLVLEQIVDDLYHTLYSHCLFSNN